MGNADLSCITDVDLLAIFLINAGDLISQGGMLLVVGI